MSLQPCTQALEWLKGGRYERNMLGQGALYTQASKQSGPASENKSSKTKNSNKTKNSTEQEKKGDDSTGPAQQPIPMSAQYELAVSVDIKLKKCTADGCSVNLSFF